MSTTGEIVKTVLNEDYADGSYWDNLTYKPSLCLIGKDRADQVPPGRAIFIKEDNQDYEFTLNRSPIFAKESCTVRVAMHSSTERENAFEDIKYLLKNSSYNLIFEDVRRENNMTVFSLQMRVKYLR